MRFRLPALSAAFLCGILVGFLIWKPHQRPPEQLPDHFADAHLPRLPFNGEWFVRWGGDTQSQNLVHHGRLSQNLALDLVQVTGADDRACNGDPAKNENYLCWGQPIYSPADGVVEVAIDGIADETPTKLDDNVSMTCGNCLHVRSDTGFVMEFCHLQCDSVAVHKGDRVKPGDLLGRCGNSGQSTEPHLHFQIQSKSGFDQGVALRPIFDLINVNGSPQKDHAPVKSEKIAPTASRVAM